MHRLVHLVGFTGLVRGVNFILQLKIVLLAFFFSPSAADMTGLQIAVSVLYVLKLV